MKILTKFQFQSDLDLLIGVTRDEGSMFSMVIAHKMFAEPTKEDFIELIEKSDNYFHNLNVEKVLDFYLNTVNTSDVNVVKLKTWDFLGDIVVKCPAYFFAKRYAEQSSPETNVFFYEFNHTLREFIPGVDMGVHHGADLFFTFGLPLLEPNTTSEENIRFTKDIVIQWTDFAKYGYKLQTIYFIIN